MSATPTHRIYTYRHAQAACIEGLCWGRTIGARCCDEVRLELRRQVLRDLLKVTERVVQQRMQPNQRDAACAGSRLDGVADRSRRLGDEGAARHSAERVPQEKHELHVRQRQEPSGPSRGAPRFACIRAQRGQHAIEDVECEQVIT